MKRRKFPPIFRFLSLLDRTLAIESKKKKNSSLAAHCASTEPQVSTMEQKGSPGPPTSTSVTYLWVD